MAQKPAGNSLMRCLLLIGCFFSLPLAAQDKIDPAKFNYDLLNQLVQDEVNTLRSRKRLDSLRHDTSLDNASADHAKYMGDNQVLTHTQKSREKRNPYDRVIYYGGTHGTIGENVLQMPIAQMMDDANGKLTYQKLAKEMVEVWKASKEHYENILNADYQVASYGFYIKDGSIYACQLLASEPFVEVYKFDKGKPVFVKNTEECLNCKRTRKKINKDQAFLGWYTVSNDSVYYWNMDSYASGGKMAKRNLAKIFGGRGTLAIDAIHSEQYDCNGNASYHNSLYYDGYYLGSIDKKSLKNDLYPDPNVIKIYVGQKPEFKDTFFQVDFNYVKRSKPCMHSMTIYVTPDHLKPTEYFTIPNPTVDMNRTIILEDSVEVRINFQRGQTNEDTSIFVPLVTALDSLEKADHQIQSIHFTGVASIEGDEQSNEKLFNKRGAIISNYLKKYYPTLPMKSDFYENFDEFRAGLVTLGHAAIVNYSDDSLRLWANQHRNDPAIENLLDETRYSAVQIIYRDYVKINNEAYGFSVQHIIDLTEQRNLRELVPLYEVMANNAIRGNLSIRDSLLNLSFPETPEFAKLHWYKFILELNLTPGVVTAEKLNYLKDIGAIPTTADYLEYRLMFNIFNSNEDIDVSDFGEILPEIKSKKQVAWIECLDLISGVENNRYSDKMVAPILLNNVLKMKFSLKQTYFICQYLIEWGYTTEPYILLSKFAKTPGQLPKLYKQYIKLGYYLGMFENKKEWKKLLMVLKNLAQNHPDEFCDLFKWDQMGVRALEYKEIAELFCKECASNP
ncbi:MAG: hypothetical protein HYZ14_14520 [Bacteroidetes bacterium]|nr:hypothetical protein [Bacteroidota bacterium]